MLPSEVNADPRRVAMATTEAARISPHAARTRQGWTAETRARDWVIDVRLACASRSSWSFERVADMSFFLSLGMWLALCSSGADEALTSA